jgi:predicted DsbA family dithiol-disulfide isomerase
MSGVAMNLHIDIISDVICPWCYVGKRRLEKAIAAIDRQVELRWLPFQLNPQMPKEGINRKEYRTRKFGSWERSLELDAKLVAPSLPVRSRFGHRRLGRCSGSGQG